MADFNPNELIIERVRAVEEYDPETFELIGRYTQIEDPSLKFTADGTDVTDAMGAPITTFYNAQSGTFDFSNSIFSMDLLASQAGSNKIVASNTNKIIVPVSETIPIGSDHTVSLKYVPVGTAKAEIKYVKVINSNNTFGKTYTLSSTASADNFTIEEIKQAADLCHLYGSKLHVAVNTICFNEEVNSVAEYIEELLNKYML